MSEKVKKEDWKMPEWMEIYRESINNTGGNTIERLYGMKGSDATIFSNAPLALICVAVKCQVDLLYTLHKNRLIK